MLELLRAGLMDTVQDAGRTGWQQYGITPGGTMDRLSMRTANLLVGNSGSEAVLEMTLTGPVIYFRQATLIALCGGEFHPEIDGAPVPLWRPVYAREGSILTTGSAAQGSRLVMALPGGIDVPEVLGSRSTFLRAGIGGMEGRALRKGDVLMPGRITVPRPQQKNSFAQPFRTASWSVSGWLRPVLGPEITIRWLRGRHYQLFGSSSLNNFRRTAYTAGSQSDRMGYRLQGAALQLKKSQELTSESVTFGTVQVPPDGQPIILMADRQTTGGYPEIAQIITADLPSLAQARPGTRIRFEEVSLAEAHRLLQKQEQALAEFQTAVRLKLQEGIE
ncbi:MULTISPECIES: biotin-dependent carboxyltransferase family protein [Sporosarcina]|uniref:5-oxoprolinase subunit C family protein n=1 Tax=Sporosarcina TaxID=1569 RepID=UPI0005913444|nr:MULTISPECIES: biotin-dependent carboxyltransferase family protein [Sporosarcina]WJY26883.1 biotin-dependent carboxyltransferase family protein [Sporosarcina sp. 0.2-SM1T-5]